MKRQTKESKKITIPAIAALLLSVKNTFIEHQARLFPFARAFFGFCLAGLFLVSCASGVSGSKRAGNIWDAWDPNIDSGRLTRFGVSTVDGQDIQTYWHWISGTSRSPYEYGYNIPHGQREVNISAIWSNGFEDSTQFTLDVKDGKKYAVYAYEIQEGQDPNAPTVLTKDYKEHGGGTFLGASGEEWGKNGVAFGIQLLGFLAAPVVLYTLPVLVPVGLYYSYKDKKKPGEGPIDDATKTDAQSTDSIAETVAQPPPTNL